MIQIYQFHPRFRMVPAYPEYHDYYSGNFDLVPPEEEKDLEKRCCIRVKIIPVRDGFQIRFTRNNLLRTWLKGQIDVEEINEEAFHLIAEVVLEQILSQVNKTEEEDVVVLVDVS